MMRYVATLLLAVSAVALGDGIGKDNGSKSMRARTLRAGSRVTVESGAVISGPLKFEREVDLYVGAGATIGPIEGVPPQRHALP